MRSFCNVFVGLCSAILMGSAMADDRMSSLVPKSAFFGGLGVSGSSVHFLSQHVYAGGTTWQPGPIIGSGAGSTDFMLNASSALVPAVQIGYFNHLAHHPWIWGGKIFYNGLNINAHRALLIPQIGSVAETAGSVTTTYPFSGNYTVQSYQQTIHHQISLIPLMGKSFAKNYLYFGAGPTAAETKMSITNMASPIAFVNGLPISPTGIGNGSNYSTHSWLFGGIAMLGATYFINSTWFMDFSYSYSMTGKAKSNWGGPWSDTLPNGSARTGQNEGTSSGRVSTQAFSLSINAAV
jgi:opacity protein-like surface antigen